MKFFGILGASGILMWVIGIILTRFNDSFARNETFHWITFIGLIVGTFSLAIYSMIVRWRWADYMRRTGTERIQDHAKSFFGLVPPKRK